MRLSITLSKADVSEDRPNINDAENFETSVMLLCSACFRIR